MKSFFQRILPGIFGEKSSPGQNAATAAAEPAANHLLPTISSRCPLISSQGDIVGFEFRLGEDIQRRISHRTNQSAKVAYVRAVLASAHLVTQSGRIGLARLPADCLVHAVDFDTLVDVWIAVDQCNDEFDLEAAAQALHTLHTQGAKVAWDASINVPLTPDFVIFRQDDQPMPMVLNALKSRPQALLALPDMVTDIATFEDLELALQSGVSYVCGALTPNSIPVEAKQALPVSPEMGRIGQLLNQLVTGAQTDVIVTNIKGDVGLSYRLLQRINTASFAHLNAGASIDQAVLMIGRDELYRWLSLLLFQFSGKRKVSSALQEVALWRSRFMELLAIEHHEEVPSQLFTLGLASMMSPILKISLTDVMSILCLHEFAKQALLEQSGPWHVYLELMRHIESQNLVDTSPVAEQFGGVAHITALADDAWSWAWSATHTKPGSDARA